MKTFGKIAAVLCAILAVLVIALIIFIQRFDLDRARPWINDKVSVATGRTFAIKGHLSARWTRPASQTGWRSWLPWPTFTARDVEIGNPEWAKRKQFAVVDAVAFELELLPLLAHKVIIPTIAVTNPVVDIERTADKQNTWTFKRSEKQPSKWDVQLRELSFANGVVTVTDAPTRIDMQADITTLGAPIALGTLLEKQRAGGTGNTDGAQGNRPAASQKTPVPADTAQAEAPVTSGDNAARSGVPGPADGGYGFAVKLSGTYRDAPLRGTGKIGGVLPLMDRKRPFPIQADVHLGSNHLTALGTLTDIAKLAAFDMRLTLGADSMADLYDLTGVALPETPKFRTAGHLTGNLDAAGNRFRYEQFTGQVGRSDLSGTLEFTTAPPRPKLSGKVNSKRLALADLGTAIGTKADPAPAAKAGKKKPAAPGAKALPATSFRTDRWHAMDVDVVFSGASIIRSEALPISDMSTHIIMNNSVLSFDPLKFGVAGGTVNGTIHLDGQRQPLDGKIDVSARHVKLKSLFPTFNAMNTSFGEINGDAKLSGRGNSSAALAGSSNGEVKLLINNGAISSTLLEEAGLNVANIVVAKLFGDNVVKINCAAADFVVKDGVLDSRIFALDTEDALINVDGSIDLGTERMMLNVHPHTKGFRVFSLRSPLYVHGTFKKPDVGVMKTPLAIRGAAALALGAVNPFASLLALLAPSNNQSSPCPAILATAREGLKGGAPADTR